MSRKWSHVNFRIIVSLKLQINNRISIMDKAKQNEYQTYFKTIVSESRQKSESSSSSCTKKIPTLNSSQLQSLKNNGVKFFPYFSKKMKVKLISEKGDGYFLLYGVKLGWFTTYITVLNIDNKGGNLESYQRLGQGRFGKVFIGKANGMLFAIKRLSLETEREIWEQKGYKSYHKKLREALHEVSVTKIMASLGTGPKLINPMGFDIVAYSNCLDFCLELGESADRWKLSCGDPAHTTFHLREDIKKSLQIMHSFHFIHGDIKPANIIRVKRSKEKRQCQSLYCQDKDYRYFLIDYSLSLFIDQPIGTKTMTSFFGTIFFVSEDMFRCRKEMKEGLVDLYENDLVGLEKTCKKFQQAEPSILTSCTSSFGFSKNNAHLNTEKYDRIYQVYHVGQTNFQYNPGESTLEKEIKQNVNILQIYKKLDLNQEIHSFECIYLPLDFNPDFIISCKNKLRRLCNFDLRRGRNKYIGQYHPLNPQKKSRNILNHNIHKEDVGTFYKFIQFLNGSKLTPNLLLSCKDFLNLQVPDSLKNEMLISLQKIVNSSFVVSQKKPQWALAQIMNHCFNSLNFENSSEQAQIKIFIKEFLCSDEAKLSYQIYIYQLYYDFICFKQQNHEQKTSELKINLERILQKKSFSDQWLILMKIMYQNCFQFYKVTEISQQSIDKVIFCDAIPDHIIFHVLEVYYLLRIERCSFEYRGEFGDKIDDLKRFNFGDACQLAGFLSILSEKKGEEKLSKKFLEIQKRWYEKNIHILSRNKFLQKSKKKNLYRKNLYVIYAKLHQSDFIDKFADTNAHEQQVQDLYILDFIEQFFLDIEDSYYEKENQKYGKYLNNIQNYLKTVKWKNQNEKKVQVYLDQIDCLLQMIQIDKKMHKIYENQIIRQTIFLQFERVLSKSAFKERISHRVQIYRLYSSLLEDNYAKKDEIYQQLSQEIDEYKVNNSFDQHLQERYSLFLFCNQRNSNEPFIYFQQLMIKSFEQKKRLSPQLLLDEQLLRILFEEGKIQRILLSLSYNINQLENGLDTEYILKFLLYLSQRIKLKKSVLHNILEQIEKKPQIIEQYTPIIILLFGFLMQFHSKPSQSQIILKFSALFFNKVNKIGLRYFMFEHICSIYYNFFLLKLKYIPRKQSIKILETCKSIIKKSQYVNKVGNLPFEQYPFSVQIHRYIDKCLQKQKESPLSKQKKSLLKYSQHLQKITNLIGEEI